jgi:hypothetical protein
MHPSKLPEGLDFLLTLDAFVRSDSSSPCFDGTLSVGVELPDGEVWWNARFGRSAETWFSTSRSRGAGAVLFVSGADKELELEGDGELLFHFLERYLERKNMVSVFGAQKSARERSRT